MKKHLNQQALLRQQSRENYGLAAVVAGLAIWVAILFYNDYRQAYQPIKQLKQITQLTIQRAATEKKSQPDIHLKKTGKQQWQVSSPYQATASTAVVNALLQRLTQSCEPVPTQDLPRQPSTLARVITNQGTYTIGELNTAADRVYVGYQQHLALCDKLVASIALAPAIHFIDKQLYSGKLTALRGQYGSVAKLNHLDLSVLDIRRVNPAIGDDWQKITLISTQGEQTYAINRSLDGKHFLLLSAEKQLLYVIAYQPSIAAILGID